MGQKHAHPEHGKIVNRLKRASGHLGNVIGMLEAGASCTEVSQQLQAVESAISAAKKALIHEHLEHCLIGSVQTTHKPRESAQVLEELKRITKYL
jgi:hypothetical protein NreA